MIPKKTPAIPEHDTKPKIRPRFEKEDAYSKKIIRRMFFE